jgi:hypothetical protein
MAARAAESAVSGVRDLVSKTPCCASDALANPSAATITIVLLFIEYSG